MSSGAQIVPCTTAVSKQKVMHTIFLAHKHHLPRLNESQWLARDLPYRRRWYIFLLTVFRARSYAAISFLDVPIGYFHYCLGYRYFEGRHNKLLLVRLTRPSASPPPHDLSCMYSYVACSRSLTENHLGIIYNARIMRSAQKASRYR